MDRRFLQNVSRPVRQGMENELMETINDLQDTLTHTWTTARPAVGLAAVQIGNNLRVIAISTGKPPIDIFVNPMIVKTKGSYKTTEGCLSFEGEQEVMRYERITVVFVTPNNLHKRIMKEFSGKYAQIIQHEIDHLNGMLI
jgi:peptide deformylase